jgi:hypothetical protein
MMKSSDPQVLELVIDDVKMQLLMFQKVALTRPLYGVSTIDKLNNRS